MAVDYCIIGSRLKQARIKAGLTQQELANYMQEKIDNEALNVSRLAIKLFKCKQIKLHLKE